MTRILLLLLICSTTWAADATLFPADVQAALAEYDQKVAKAKADLVGKIQKAQDAATKKGNLDLALALKAKAGELNGEEPATKQKPGDVDAKGSYKCTHTNDPVKEIFLKDGGQGLTGLGDKFTWAVKDGVLSFTWKDGTTSKGEVHPKVIVMTSTGKTASGEDRCGYYLERE